MPSQCSGKPLLAKGVDIIAIAIFFLSDTIFKYQYGCPGCFSTSQYLHVYLMVKTWIILVPKLFGIHDVSLTPTKKVA
ncbi:hypothetical protein K492DRAFT_21388 [Lichtheimia hyalospora FSU 10163]|nr:hypothetical protein K492DRAFT_21388 [Lichtheimia hyalospora FSU 10163]